MTQEQNTCLPVAVWFLHAESGDPLGQIYRRDEEAVPYVGLVITGAGTFARAEVVQYTELRATCAMRRFRVVVRELRS